MYQVHRYDFAVCCTYVLRGCQMAYFRTKKSNWGNFWRVLQCWCILWAFGRFYGHLLYFTAIWYILWLFGIFFPFWYVVSRKSCTLDDFCYFSSWLLPASKTVLVFFSTEYVSEAHFWTLQLFSCIERTVQYWTYVHIRMYIHTYIHTYIHAYLSTGLCRSVACLTKELRLFTFSSQLTYFTQILQK
jgi:hypothetical protein